MVHTVPGDLRGLRGPTASCPSRGSEQAEMVPSLLLPSPEPAPSAAISELTELLEGPLGPIVTTEGPFTQGVGQEGRVFGQESLRPKSGSQVLRPQWGAAWGEFRGRSRTEGRAYAACGRAQLCLGDPTPPFLTKTRPTVVGGLPASPGQRECMGGRTISENKWHLNGHFPPDAIEPGLLIHEQ